MNRLISYVLLCIYLVACSPSSIDENEERKPIANTKPSKAITTNNPQLHLYEGTIGKLPVKFILTFDKTKWCSSFSGYYYYPTYNPNILYRLKGHCGMAVCSPSDNGSPKGNMISLKEFTDNKKTAALDLCFDNATRNSLKGTMINNDGKNFPVKLIYKSAL